MIGYYDLERRIAQEVASDATLGAASFTQALAELPQWSGYVRLQQVATTFARQQPRAWEALTAAGFLASAVTALVDAPLDKSGAFVRVLSAMGTS